MKKVCIMSFILIIIICITTISVVIAGPNYKYSSVTQEQNSNNCFNAKLSTSLNSLNSSKSLKPAIACITLEPSKIIKNIDNSKKYKEIKIKKIRLGQDAVAIKNDLGQLNFDFGNHNIEKIPFHINVIPVLVEKSQLSQIPIGSIIHVIDENLAMSYDDNDTRAYYYVTGYVENAELDGLYRYSHNQDIEDYMGYYGSCGRACSFADLEIVQWVEVK